MANTAELSRVERKRRKRKDELVASAMDIVLEQGFEALTMARLAERLDLTAGALYRYFPSKDVLVGSIEACALQQLKAQLQAQRAVWTPTIPKRAPAPVYELVAIGLFYEQLVSRQPKLVSLLSKTLGETKVLVNDESAANEVALAMQQILDLVQLEFEQAQSIEALSPGQSDERTCVYWASHHGVLQVDKLGRFDPNLHAVNLGPALRRALLSGWGAEKRMIQQAETWAHNQGPSR